MQILYNLEFEDKSRIDVTREFIRPSDYQDVADILVTTEDYIKLCQEIAPGDLQHIVHPKALSSD